MIRVLAYQRLDQLVKSRPVLDIDEQIERAVRKSGSLRLDPGVCRFLEPTVTLTTLQST